MTIRLMMLHQHTKFGSKIFCDSEDIIQKISRQTSTDIVNLHYDLDLECSNPKFQQDTPAYDAVLLNKSLVANRPAV